MCVLWQSDLQISKTQLRDSLPDTHHQLDKTDGNAFTYFFTLPPLTVFSSPNVLISLSLILRTNPYSSSSELALFSCRITNPKIAFTITSGSGSFLQRFSSTLYSLFIRILSSSYSAIVFIAIHIFIAPSAVKNSFFSFSSHSFLDSFSEYVICIRTKTLLFATPAQVWVEQIIGTWWLRSFRNGLSVVFL